MPIFISHRTADDALAQTVYNRLKFTHGISCYIDNVDALVNKMSQRDLTSYIVKKLNECTNLMAIVTANTQGSWWVPFEIGVARQAPRIITSYFQGQSSALPEYLQEWPVLTKEQEIDSYAVVYKQQSQAKRQIILEKRASFTDSAEREVAEIYRALKGVLGQR